MVRFVFSEVRTMYTVVLLAALSGGEAPALGHHKKNCDGCSGSYGCGGGYYDCTGCSGFYASCSGSYGCCGGCSGYSSCSGGYAACCGGYSSCHGGSGDCHGSKSHHFFGKHHKKDCNGCHATVIYSSCCGGYMGCCGGGYSGACFGGCAGCYGGCYEGVPVQPAPPPVKDGGKKKDKEKEDAISIPTPTADEVGFHFEALTPEKDAFTTRIARLLSGRLALKAS
jgi:hypothetical protein